MREFFRGWRRKVGCVTLLMAAAFTAAWFRSQVYFDYVGVEFRENVYSLNSDRGTLAISCIWKINPVATNWYPLGWITMKVANDLPDHHFFEWKDTQIVSPAGTSRYQSLVLSHLSIAIPLSVLSAYLILWKPRKRTEPEHA